VQTLEIGFRTVNATNPGAETLSWASSHGEDGIVSVPDESVMITGDGNLIEVHATLRFSLSHPRTFLFEVKDPLHVLRSAGESVLRETIAGQKFNDLLTTNRAVFQEKVREHLSERLAEYSPKGLDGQYGPKGLGVRLEGVALTDLHPPREVVADYHAVTRAKEGLDEKVNRAEAASLKREREAKSAALSIVRQAGADRFAKTKQAEAERDVFLARQHARTHLSLVEEGKLIVEAFQAWQNGLPPSQVQREYELIRKERLSGQAALTDFRIYWDALAQVLAGREKIIIDADKVPGKRQLLLFDPDLLKLPLLSPSTRSPEINPRLDNAGDKR
jgi:regulator of protease activity HflC (stomatin/prohibitin superfamily)